MCAYREQQRPMVVYDQDYGEPYQEEYAGTPGVEDYPDETHKHFKRYYKNICRITLEIAYISQSEKGKEVKSGQALK